MNQAYKNLYAALSRLETPEIAERFLLDLCTPAEIKAMAERLEIAALLERDELSYRDISHRTGASTTTVARVARFLKQENHGGYRQILQLMTPNKGQKNDTDKDKTTHAGSSRRKAAT